MPFVSHVDDVAVFALIHSPSGPVYREIRKRANRVERAARRMVGVDTGALRSSIHTRIIPGSSPTFSIGSSLGYALMHHQGTRRHIIRPNLRENLRFKVRGRVVYASQVVHPGTRPNHYLTVPLARYGRG